MGKDVEINVSKPAGALPKVFFWVGDYSGCGYYRLALPGIVLVRNKHWKVEASQNIDPKHFGWDVVAAQRTYQQGTTLLLEALKEAGMPVVFDIDDQLLKIDRTNTRKAIEAFNDVGNRKRLVANMRRADVLTVSTEALREEFGKHNPNTIVLPNYVDERSIDMPRKPKETDRLVIGWAGGASHKGDFGDVSGVLNSIVHDFDAEFHTIGADFSVGVSDSRRTYRGWFDDIGSYYNELNFDIGIAPIAKTKFNECKSYIKALEYAAAGIPVVATRYGPYKDFVKHGETGFLAKNERQFNKYIRQLAADPDLRQKMGRAAKQQARQYTMQGNIQPVVDMYKNLVDGREIDQEKVRKIVLQRIPELTQAAAQ